MNAYLLWGMNISQRTSEHTIKNKIYETLLKVDLGRRQHCSDNMIMFSEHIVFYIVISLCLYSLTTRIFQIFSCHWSSTALSRCRCREAKKLSRAQLWLRVYFQGFKKLLKLKYEHDYINNASSMCSIYYYLQCVSTSIAF